MLSTIKDIFFGHNISPTQLPTTGNAIPDETSWKPLEIKDKNEKSAQDLQDTAEPIEIISAPSFTKVGRHSDEENFDFRLPDILKSHAEILKQQGKLKEAALYNDKAEALALRAKNAKSSKLSDQSGILQPQSPHHIVSEQVSTHTLTASQDLAAFMGVPSSALTIDIEQPQNLDSQTSEQNEPKQYPTDMSTGSQTLALIKQEVQLAPPQLLNSLRYEFGPVRVYLDQADMYYRQKHWKQAIAACQEALSISPNVAEAYKLWGNILQQMGKTTEAMGYYAKALVIKPDYPEVYANLGSLYAKLKQWDEAIQYYHKAIECDPEFAGAYRNLARIWHKQNNLEEEARCLYLAFSLEPELGTAEEFYQLGNYLFEHDKLNEAIHAYQKAVELNPDFLMACNKLAEALEEQGDWKTAVSYYRKVLDLRAETVTASKKESTNHLSREQANPRPKSSKEGHKPRQQYQIKRKTTVAPKNTSRSATPKKALRQQHESLMQAAIAQPQSDSIQVKLGDLCMSQKDWVQAIEAYKAALRINAKQAAVYLKLGRAFTKLKKLTEAAESYHRAFELEETFATLEQRVKLARTFRELKIFKKAVIHYKQALKLEPKNASLFQELAEVYKRAGQTEPAIECLYQVINLKSDHISPDQCVRIGDAFLARQNVQKAVNCYQVALQIEPNFSLAQTKLKSGLQLLKGKIQPTSASNASELDRGTTRSTSQITPIKSQKPEPTSTELAMQYHQQAVKLAEQSRWDEAIEAYHQSIQLEPNFPWSHHNLGDLYKKRKQWDQAIEAYRQASRINPESPWTFYNLGEVLTERAQWKEAADAYGQAFRLDPNLQDLLKKLAQSLQHSSKIDHERALELYSEAVHQGLGDEDIFHKLIAHQFRDADIYVKFGNYLLAHERTDEALFLYHTASKINPENAEIWLTLCNILRDNGQTSAAIQYCQEAIDIMPDSSALHLQVSSFLFESQHYEQAIQSLKKCLELDPNCIEAQKLLAEIMYQQDSSEEAYFAYLDLGEISCREGDLEAAITAFQTCLSINSEHCWAYNCLGNIYRWKNELDQAISYYKKAAELKPDLAGVYQSLGDACSAKGNIDEATQFYAMALQHDT